MTKKGQSVAGKYDNTTHGKIFSSVFIKEAG